MAPLTIIICGDRHWGQRRGDYGIMRRYVLSLPSDTIVVHGAAKGADTMAGKLAAERGLEVRAYPALWSVHGRAAGPIRNKQMLVQGKPDRVVAFHRDIDNSKGTKDMLHQAARATVPTELYPNPNTRS